MTVKKYKGYEIAVNVYGSNEYSVQYYGDDCIFSTLEGAKAFIDEIKEYETDDLDHTKGEKTMLTKNNLIAINKWLETLIEMEEYLIETNPQDETAIVEYISEIECLMDAVTLAIRNEE